MSTADEFRDKAEECRQQSEKAISPRDKVVWLRIAESWLKLAEKAGPAPAKAQAVSMPTMRLPVAWRQHGEGAGRRWRYPMCPPEHESSVLCRLLISCAPAPIPISEVIE